MHELIDEQRRRPADAIANEREVGRLDGLVSDQMIAEGHHQLPVLARVGIGDCGNLGSGNRPARLRQQCRMQRALDHARVGRRAQFRPRQIGFEKLVSNEQPAALVAIEQMMPAGEPEIRHACYVSTPCLSIIARRGTARRAAARSCRRNAAERDSWRPGSGHFGTAGSGQEETHTAAIIRSPRPRERAASAGFRGPEPLQF